MYDGEVKNKGNKMKAFNKQSDDVLSVHLSAVFNLFAANPSREMTLF